MVVINICILIVLVECLAVEAFIFLWLSGAFFKFVASCAEGARFLSFTITVLVVESGAFKEPICHYVVLSVTNCPSKVNFLLYQQFPCLGTYFDYQVSGELLFRICAFSVDVSCLQMNFRILGYQGSLCIFNGDIFWDVVDNKSWVPQPVYIYIQFSSALFVNVLL